MKTKHKNALTKKVWKNVYQTDNREFSRPEYWSGQPLASAGNLPAPGIEPGSPALQVILYQLSYQESPIAWNVYIKYELTYLVFLKM